MNSTLSISRVAGLRTARSTILVGVLLHALGTPAGLGGQSKAQLAQFETHTGTDHRGAAGPRLIALCGGVVAEGAAEAPGDRAFRQGCVAAMDFAGTLAHSDGMRPRAARADSLAGAAMRHFTAALGYDPSSDRPARGLAVVALELNDPSIASLVPLSLEAVAEHLFDAVHWGVRDNVVLRACASFHVVLRDAATARWCSHLAMDTGRDSTWHVLRLAWLAHEADHHTERDRLVREAILAANDVVSQDEVGGIIGQIFWPYPASFLTARRGEGQWLRDDWEGLSPSARLEWVETHLTTPIDGRHLSPPRPSSSRKRSLDEGLAEQFPLLRYVGSGFSPCVQHFHSSGSLSRRACGRRDPEGFKAIEVHAQPYRLWEPVSGSPVTLVTIAMRASDLSPQTISNTDTAKVTSEWRQWSGPEGGWVRESGTVLFAAVGSDGWLHAHHLAKRDGVVSSWAAVVTDRGPRRGRVVRDDPLPFPESFGVVSDLVLGSTRSGAPFTMWGEPIHGAARGELSRQDEAVLYFQVYGALAGTRLSATISLHHDRGTDEPPVLSFRLPIESTGTVTAVRRGFDFSRIPAGRYRLAVRVENGAGEMIGRNDVEFRLR